MFPLNILSFFFLPISIDYSVYRCWGERRFLLFIIKTLLLGMVKRKAQHKTLQGCSLQESVNSFIQVSVYHHVVILAGGSSTCFSFATQGLSLHSTQCSWFRFQTRQHKQHRNTSQVIQQIIQKYPTRPLLLKYIPVTQAVYIQY